MTAAWMHRGRHRAGIAWLAVVALLINALLPGALSAATASAPRHSSWCGSHPSNDGPAPVPTTPICDRCVLCFAPASGLAPPVPAAAGAPLQAANLIARTTLSAVVVSRSSYRPAQPRGPPLARS